MGLGIGSKPDPLSYQTRIQNLIKVILEKTPDNLYYLQLIYCYYIVNPFYMVSSVQAICGASGLRLEDFGTVAIVGKRATFLWPVL